MLLVKVIVVILLLIIFASLFSALYFLIKDKGQTNRSVKALTARISLSVFAFILLMVANYFGIIGSNPPPF